MKNYKIVKGKEEWDIVSDLPKEEIQSTLSKGYKLIEVKK